MTCIVSCDVNCLLQSLCFYEKIRRKTQKTTHRVCITASGSRNHQLLAAMKKRRKSPNLPQNEGVPPLFWVLSEWGRAPIILGALQNQQAPIHFPILPPPTCLQHQLIPPPPPYLGQGGDHTPLHPFWPQILHGDLVASGRLSNNITGDHYES